jgi:hypothetical protein
VEPEEIDRASQSKMDRWMEESGVVIKRHAALSSGAKRWIGVVRQSYGSTSDHCLLMSGRECIFDSAGFVPPDKDEPAGPYGYADIDYAITIDRN